MNQCQECFREREIENRANPIAMRPQHAKSRLETGRKSER